MKTIYFVFFFLISTITYSQDINEIKRIDSIVMRIEQTKYKIQTDSTKIELADLGLYSKSYLKIAIYNGEIIKFINNVHMIDKRGDSTKITDGSNSFYFWENKLIKVNEIFSENNTDLYMGWYFQNEKLIYSTFQNELADARGKLLISMSKSLIEEIIKRTY